MSLDIAQKRLHKQHIAGPPLASPSAVVRWLGAVQAQDYAGAKWAVAQRSHGVTDAAMDQAFADGLILRTHVMRPTWHFVAPEDIRWLLALTASRVKAVIASFDRRLGLDDHLVGRSNAALVDALADGRHMTRSELAGILNQAGIATEGAVGQRLGQLVMHAELDGMICSGARRGKQFTYALLDERAPNSRVLARDEALATLAERYFTSHGPATVKDFVWWSGLTVADARRGLQLGGTYLTDALVDGREYWFSPATPSSVDGSPTAYLLSNYDEYIVGYADRSAVYDRQYTALLDARGDILFHHTIVLDGQVVGTWKRARGRGANAVETSLFTPLTSAGMQAVTVATERYAAFIALPVMTSSSS